MLPENLASIRSIINRLKQESPLAAPHVALIAASKQQPASLLREAIAAGVSDFGENRVQEALAKWPELRREFPQVRLHLIGALQSNKAADAVAHFDAIHTVDRIKLAEALAEEMARQNRRPECFIQVNTGEEPQKSGVIPQEADALIAHCKTLSLPLAGLMCVPPADQHPAPHFALLHEMARRHGLPNLSMGMSGDYETAIKMGATHIRIGTALFGERKAEASA